MMNFVDLHRLITPKKFVQTAIGPALARLVAGLDAVAHETEGDFLVLGDNLQQIHAESATLHRRVAENIQIFRPENEDQEGILGRIEEAVNTNYGMTRAFLVEVENKHATVQAINDHLAPIAAGSESLRKIGMYLRALGIYTSIEISRSKQMFSDFAMVSEDTMALAEGIRKISNNLIEQLEAIGAILQSTLASTTERSMSLAELVDRAGNTAEDAFDKCTVLVDRALHAMERASALSQKVGEKIGTIVMGIQFHDTCRQRLEHIIEALTGTAAILQEAEKSGRHTDQNRQRYAEAFVAFEVQKSQLWQLIREAEELYEDQCQAFTDIVDAIDQYTDCLREFSIGNSADGDVLSEIAISVASIDAIKNDGDCMAGEIKKTAAEADGVISSLTTFIKEALALSNKVHINALNSIIQANKFGEIGRPLEVLSQDMATVARQVEEVIPSFSAQISEITSLAKQGKQELPGKQKTAAKTKQFFSVEDIRVVFEQFRDNTESLLADGRSLGKSIAGEREKLRFLRVLINSLLKWHEELAALVEGIEPLAGDVSTARRLFSLKKFANRYTMARERIIHHKSLIFPDQSATPVDPETLPGQSRDEDSFPEMLLKNDGKEAAAAEKAYERDNAFGSLLSAGMAGMKEKQEEKRTKGAGEFGDNVELF